ncbi:hypothetical protein CYMTET_9189 [Cymbomonas tetramitiformis]|uniref:Uncharacterized protein n=1 Tax=Cymbomonas tetramitiformis TaxID=36881 RepID=A0AAE0LFR1_9CHLO|nr:hypothetical protein CYMTET_9189 [Cymbomonas tetramitiformis]
MSLESTTPLFVKKEHHGLFNKGARSLIACNPSIFLPLPNTPRTKLKPAENPKRSTHSKAQGQWIDAASSIATRSRSEFRGLVRTLQAEKVKCARRMKQLERLDKFTLASSVTICERQL